MHTTKRSLLLTTLVAFSFTIAPATAQPKKRPAPVTQADIDRLEKKIDEQQKVIEKLVTLQKQYLAALDAVFENGPPPPTPPPSPPTSQQVDPKPATTPPAGKVEPKPAPKPAAVKKATGVGTVVGKIAGASDAIVYVDGFVNKAKGTATMKQEGKAFLPATLVVQAGSMVSFPNRDAIFHNVFSVTPDHSFDLGSYRQGESKTVTMSRPGVVTVYCNMHPQMVGHILVVPNANYVRAGKDGFFRLTNVPSGSHKIVAWAPNAKPVSIQATVVDGEVVTVELEVKKGKSSPHSKKDGLPYGSYEK